jgi:hypothetical protein
LPQLGQQVSSFIPQELQATEPFTIGFSHFGHRKGPTGLTLPQFGHAFESGVRLLQYLQGRLNVGMLFSPLLEETAEALIHLALPIDS